MRRKNPQSFSIAETHIELRLHAGVSAPKSIILYYYLYAVLGVFYSPYKCTGIGLCIFMVEVVGGPAQATVHYFGCQWIRSGWPLIVNEYLPNLIHSLINEVGNVNPNPEFTGWLRLVGWSIIFQVCRVVSIYWTHSLIGLEMLTKIQNYQVGFELLWRVRSRIWNCVHGVKWIIFFLW